MDLYQAFSQRTGPGRLWISLHAALLLVRKIDPHTQKLILPVLASVLYFGVVRADGPATSAQNAPQNESFAISSQYPTDVSDGTPEFSHIHDPEHIPESQRVFDRFAWQSFLALNWAGKADGTPDDTVSLEQDVKDGLKAPRTWEAWAETNMLFKANGERPEPWIAGQLPKWDARHSPDAKQEVVWISSKIRNRNAVHHTSLADENIQAFTAPLVDQNGNWVRYEVRVNRTEYNYVLSNQLYSLEGQADFLRRAGVIEFPKDGDIVASERMTYGATEIKLSWKQLGQFNRPANFDAHKTDADYLEKLGLSAVYLPGTSDVDHYDVSDDEAFARNVTWFNDRSRFLWRYVRIIHNGGMKDANGTPIPDPVSAAARDGGNAHC